MTARPVALAVALLASAALAAACSSSSSGTPQANTAVPTLPSTLPVSTGPTLTITAPGTSPASSQTAASTSPKSSPSVTIRSAPSTPEREVTVTSSDGTRTYDIKIWWQVSDTDCADHAYGTPVIQYLTAHPCMGLTRLLATTTVNGRAAGFAQSSIGFVGNAPDVYQVAGNFAVLEKKNGTGSINDLLREGYRLPNGPPKLPSSEAFDVESQDSDVTIVDAFYLSGSTPNNDKALVQMAQDVYLQF